MIIDATTEFTRLAKLPEGVGLGDSATRRLRVKLLAEEFQEYLIGEAINVRPSGETSPPLASPDATEIADGLADIIVIAWGTLLTYFGETCAKDICREVWTSNLAKVDGTHGDIVRRGDGKLLKPDGWQPPDIEGVLRRYGFLDASPAV